jgi:class 3 adenylate cyclase
MELENNLANIDIDRKRYRQAAVRLDSLFALALAMDSKSVQAKVQNARARMFADQGKFREAYHYIQEYNTLQEQALNSERVKVVNEMMEKYESEKKARQIQALEVANLGAKLQNEKIRSARNRFLYAGLGILLIALGLVNRMNSIRKSRRAIQKEKDISEGLLLNILPATVAAELKEKGFAEAQQFDNATVLFSDFKEFTTVSEQLSAAELVKELNACFKAFDEIMAKHGIEKIKTIGDAYMATGGIPDRGTEDTAHVILAALDMQQFILNRWEENKAAGLPAFEMRVGVHTGPAVAGIVGVKKFQYDIWGDTVNIANRMESHGEVGKVNISEVTYQLVRDNPLFTFTDRGTMPVKGKGHMKMYFVALASN